MLFTTERLFIRNLLTTDAEFIYKLVNQESWLRFIGDKNIHTLIDAENYINNGPIMMYHKYGFGLWAVELKSTNTVIGICGLIKRDNLPEIDLGFAFLDQYTNNGYAFEACSHILNHAKNKLNKQAVLAIVMPENTNSIKLLKKLGFCDIKPMQLNANSHNVNLMEIKF